MLRDYKLILITGFPRSGTTWIGEEIARRFDVDYIFEPYNIKYHPGFKNSLHLRNLISNFLDESYYHHGWHYEKDYLPADQKLFSKHIDDLRAHYKLEKPVLVIKQPLTAKLAWAIEALNPDYVFWVDRHPGGILASFIQRNVITKWSDKEYRLYEASSYAEHNDQTVGFHFKACKKPVQRFFKLFFSGRKLAFSALEDFGKYSVISYEATCSDVNDGFEQIVEILEPNEQPETIDHSYKKDKSHLNTNLNSRVKMLSWQRELPNSVLLGMKKYFHNAEDFEDYLEMMPELENSGSIISKITKRLFS